jgi:hypothetical protein
MPEFAAGASLAELAADFGISERHARRLTADVVPFKETRQPLTPVTQWGISGGRG